MNISIELAISSPNSK